MSAVLCSASVSPCPIEDTRKPVCREIVGCRGVWEIDEPLLGFREFNLKMSDGKVLGRIVLSEWFVDDSVIELLWSMLDMHDPIEQPPDLRIL